MSDGPVPVCAPPNYAGGRKSSQRLREAAWQCTGESSRMARVLGNQVPCSGPHPADKGVADRGHDKALPTADASGPQMSVSRRVLVESPAGGVQL